VKGAGAVFEIRKATPNDALGITIVNVYTWKTAYQGLLPDSVIDERIAALPARAEKTKETIAASGDCFIATVGGVVIGFCRYGACRNDTYPDDGEIYAIYVLKGYNGTGVGRALLSAAIDELRQRGCRAMVLNCLQGNPSRSFYEHMGGKVVGQRTDELLGVIMTEDILHFEL